MYPGINENIISKSIGLLKNINFSAFLDGTQKTLGVINQAIPIYYQVKPIVSNAKTLFKISNIMNESDNSTNKKTTNNTNSNNSSPIFYI